MKTEKPRRGAFEIDLVLDGQVHPIWSGLKKGPPRRLKFPDAQVVLSALRPHLR